MNVAVVWLPFLMRSRSGVCGQLVGSLAPALGPLCAERITATFGCLSAVPVPSGRAPGSPKLQMPGVGGEPGLLSWARGAFFRSGKVGLGIDRGTERSAVRIAGRSAR